MSKLIDEKEVRRVALLSRLTLAEGEVERLANDMSNILSYIQKLKELDTGNAVATSHAVSLPTKFREDQARPGLPVELALQNAPERLGDGFGVPKIIE